VLITSSQKLENTDDRIAKFWARDDQVDVSVRQIGFRKAESLG
jgi:hypothetical protein